VIELKNITLSKLNKRIIDDVNISLERGKIYTIMGTNGSGKTTLANILMGLSGYEVDSGSVVIDGEDITNKGVYERSKLGISKLWQEPPRYKGITVYEYLILGGKIKSRREEVTEIMKIVGMDLKLYEDRLLDSTLSGGERKRIELASSLLLKHDYIIFDEPDSGIDIMSLEMINTVLRTIVARNGTPIVVTHREEIARIANYSYLICDGRVVKKGTVEGVISFYKGSCDRCKHPNEPELGSF